MENGWKVGDMLGLTFLISALAMVMFSALNSKPILESVGGATIFAIIGILIIWIIHKDETPQMDNRLEEQKREMADSGPIFDEIKTMFEDIKEEGIIASQFQEQKEIIASNFIIAYYLSKLERKL